MKYQVYQVEASAHCTAKCQFCPHPEMTRPQGEMSLDTFDQILRVFPNRYFALHHFGEPLLNKELPYMIEMAKKVGVEVEFSTNGGFFDPQLLQQVLDEEPYMIRIAWDAFKPVEFLKFAAAYNKSTIIKAHSVTGVLPVSRKPFNNFAGAVKGATEVHGECYFKKYGYVCVLWDGRVVPCCQDFDGRNIIGSVFTPSSIAHEEDYPMCKRCGGMQFADDGLWEARRIP